MLHRERPVANAAVAGRGVYEGAEGIRRFFADIEDTGPDFRLDLERLQAVGGERVLAFLGVTSHGRASGLPTPAETGNV